MTNSLFLLINVLFYLYFLTNFTIQNKTKKMFHVEQLKKINMKKLTKSEMAYKIHNKDHWNTIGMYYDHFKRNEVLEEYNKMFNTNEL